MLNNAYLSENAGDRDEYVNSIDDLLRPGRYVVYALKFLAGGTPPPEFPEFIEARILDVNQHEVLFLIFDAEHKVPPVPILHRREELYAVAPSKGPENQGGDGNRD